MITNEEKMGIINQHMRNVQVNKYNLELTLLEENALTSPNTETVTAITAQIAEANKKIAVLETELESVQAE
jgi:hypothetical protein